MDIVSCSELPGIIVTPAINVVVSIEHTYVTAAHLDILDSVLKLCLQNGKIFSALEERREHLYAAYQLGHLFVVFKESIGRPRAQWPTPKQKRVSIINHRQVLAIVSHNIRYVEPL